MLRIERKKKARDQVKDWNVRGESVGFVPTMGALHRGHLSLVDASLQECDRTVVSVFLNPVQFGEGEDLERYPRCIDDDIKILEPRGVDMVCAPSVEEMYPDGFCTWVVQEGLTEVLCGAFRSGHFRGVCTVVAKLMSIIPATRAYFGRKDLQQSAVIKRMVSDIDIPVKISVMPVVREPDGLALSSRNQYLSEKQRREAPMIHDALLQARSSFKDGVSDVQELTFQVRNMLSGAETINIEYVEIVHPSTLKRTERASADSVAALAAYAGDTRLIDNMPLGGRLDDIYMSVLHNPRTG